MSRRPHRVPVGKFAADDQSEDRWTFMAKVIGTTGKRDTQLLADPLPDPVHRVPLD